MKSLRARQDELAAPLVQINLLRQATKSFPSFEEKMGDLKIANARLEERIANTDKRADELRDQVARLAQSKGAPKQEPKPKPKLAPKKST